MVQVDFLQVCAAVKRIAANYGYRFREYHLLPSAVMKLGYGERQVLYAFIRYEMEEREKKWQATK